MSNTLRQSTQIVVRVGPFLDATDAVSPETGITLGAADQAEALKAAGAATVDIAAATWAAITGSDGWYDLTLTTSHTDTVGELVVVVQDSSVCLPVFVRFQVVEEAVYDAMFAASAAGPLQSTTPGNTLDVTATGAAGIDWANIENPTFANDLSGTDIQLVDTTTTNTDMVAAAPTAAAVADAVWDETMVGHSTADTAGLVMNDWQDAGRLDAILDIIAADVVNLDGSPMVGTDGAALASAWTATRAGYVDSLNGHTAQTGDSFARIGAAGAGLTDLGGMATAMKAEVNAEVLDVINTDTFAEPGQEAPGTTVSLAAKIGYLYKQWRNRSTQDATTYSLYADDATTVDQKATVSDNGTTADKGEVGTGP